MPSLTDTRAFWGRLALAHPNRYWLCDQYSNLLSWRAHYHTVSMQPPGAGMGPRRGTSGRAGARRRHRRHLMGVGRLVPETAPDLFIAAVIPEPFSGNEGLKAARGARRHRAADPGPGSNRRENPCRHRADRRNVPALGRARVVRGSFLRRLCACGPRDRGRRAVSDHRHRHLRYRRMLRLHRDAGGRASVTPSACALRSGHFPVRSMQAGRLQMRHWLLAQGDALGTRDITPADRLPLPAHRQGWRVRPV